MKTFPNYDNTLCNCQGCKKKEQCVRYLTYQKLQKEKGSYLIAMHKPDDDEHLYNCSLFIKAE